MEVMQAKHPAEPTKVLFHSDVLPLPKRIKLSHPSSEKPTLITHLNQLDMAKGNEYFEILCEIGDSWLFDESGAGEIWKKLCEHFRKSKESIVRTKLLMIMSDFVCEVKTGHETYVDDLLVLLKDETSNKVLSQGLGVLMKVEKVASCKENQIERIISLAKSKLKSSSHNVQRHALLVLGTFIASTNELENIELIGKYSDSQDARVRAQSLNSILMICLRGIFPTTPTLYSRATAGLKDDYECVRKEALQLIFVIGNKYSENMIAVGDSEQKIRLVDDAFGKVCNALCDLSMHVRVQAAQLLGRMDKVSDEFLHQTLDKKLMSNMRRKKSLHERSYEHFTSGEWSTGKKWADDAPKEILKADTVLLVASGACGAFVQGLEDEFLEVRSASIDSMCQLALKNQQFAITSLDFLVDMFNDEIESVRLEAIYSLTAISKHIVLREDQLEIMMNSLEDYSVEVREGLHLMLGACKVATQSCLILVVQKVLDVLSKYPQDKHSVFMLLQKIGKQHPDLCMSLTPQLLQDHPFFDSTEKDVEDPAYICILIMLFNGVQNLPSMLSLFPDTTLKHYAFLRDTMPEFVPQLPIGGRQIKLHLTEATGSKQFLETLLNNIQASYLAPNARQALLEAAQDNLARLAEIDPSLSGTANFTADFLGAQLLMERLQGSLASSKAFAPSKECVNRLVQKCLRLQNLFSNLTLLDLLHVKQICLRASALQLILSVKDKSQSALAPCQLLLHMASDTSAFLKENTELTPDAFTKSILVQIASLTDPKPGRVFREIHSIVQTAASIATPEINTTIKMCTAVILEPTESYSEDNVLKVTAGLIAALPFVAEIDNLLEFQKQNLRIRIKYPDQNILHIVPKRRDLRKVNLGSSENKWKLRTQVLLSHGVWTECAQVEINVCLAVRHTGNELELCKPVKVMLFPKSVKRGV